MPIEEAVAAIRASPALAPHASAILAHVRPHIRFTPRRGRAADNAPGASRLGGEPDLPSDMGWPLGPGFDGETPMDFLAQIDLDTVARRDVDGVLPRTGVLAFFVAQNYARGLVVHGEHAELARVSRPGPRRRRAPKVPTWAGIDVAADLILPPPWSRFVSSAARSATAWDARTNQTGRGDTVVELPSAAHEAYVAIYERWLEAVGWEQHGMLGYDRMMEGAQRADELALLRLDDNGVIPYDFVEVVSIYWLISARALAARAFDEAEVFCGTQI